LRVRNPPATNRTAAITAPTKTTKAPAASTTTSGKSGQPGGGADWSTRRGGQELDQLAASGGCGRRRRWTERTRSMLGFTANSTDPTRNSQSTVVVVEVEEEADAPDHEAGGRGEADPGPDDLVSPEDLDVPRAETAQQGVEQP